MIELLIAIAVIAPYPVLLLYLCRRHWKKVLYHRPGAKFQYHITDIWALAVGMLPTSFLAAYIFKDYQSENRSDDKLLWICLLLLFMCASQLTGAIIGLIEAELDLFRERYHQFHGLAAKRICAEAHPRERSIMKSALYIILGAWCGLLLPGLYWSGICFIIFCIFFWPVTLVVLPIWYFWKKPKKIMRKIKPPQKPAMRESGAGHKTTAPATQSNDTMK